MRMIPISLLAALVAVGCETTKEEVRRDTVTQEVGEYGPAPRGIDKPRVAAPPFLVNGPAAKPRMEGNAADILTTLLHKSRRFSVIERAQLEQLLREQSLEGIVRPGEMAAMGNVRGVDYLMLGKVTNLRVQTAYRDSGFNVGGVDFGKVVGRGNAGINTSKVEIKTQCGVDLRLVDPSTGEIQAANFSEFERIDSADGWGVSVGRVGAGTDADLQVNEDDMGKILRMVLDDALIKMMPEIDRFLRDRTASRAADGDGE